MLGLISELWPNGHHGVGYAFMAQRLSYDDWDARLWFDGDRLVGFGWRTGWRDPAGLSYEYRDPALFDEILEWADPDVTTAKTGDDAAVATLRRHGYDRDADGHENRWNRRPLDVVDEPQLPAGYRLATMADSADLASRTAAHRAAFTTSGKASRFTDEVYETVRGEAPWRADLDCVVIEPGGDVAAFALAWLDPRHSVGELEPVGVLPAHRRRGLARAVCLYALQRLQLAGAHTALVGCGEPATCALYESIGFREAWRAIPYARASSPA